MVHPMFWGDSHERDEARRFDPEGMSAISRGLSVRDTPGAHHRQGICILKGCWPAQDVSPFQKARLCFKTPPRLSGWFTGLCTTS